MARNFGLEVQGEEQIVEPNYKLQSLSLPLLSSVSETYKVPSALKLPLPFKASKKFGMERVVAASRRVVELREQLHSVRLEGSPTRVNRIKRPRNAFILYCLDQRPILQQSFQGADNRVLSKLLGIMWKDLSSVDKSQYMYRAAEERARVNADYPDCKFPIDKLKKLKKRLKKAEDDLAEISSSCSKCRTEVIAQELQHVDDCPGIPNSLSCSDSPAAEWATLNESLAANENGTDDLLFSELVEWPMWNSSTDFAMADADSSGLLLDSCFIDDIKTELSDNKEEPTVNVHVTVDSGSVTVSEDTTTILLEKDCIVSCPDSLMCADNLEQEPEGESNKRCEEATTKHSKRRRKKSSPHSFGCRRYYGIRDQDRWCSGCRNKKRCKRNIEQLR